MRLILASASPRRRALLAERGLSFEIVPADVDETLAPGCDPERGACELAERKALAVAARVAEQAGGEDACVLAGDTIVAVGFGDAARMLGKAADEDEARAMLEALSGQRHRVITGVCALRVRDGLRATDFERTFVTMRVLSPGEIDAYVRSQEWRDRAGGYAIQESADRFVTRLEEGGFDNVVGLPVELALRLLARIDAPCRPR